VKAVRICHEAGRHGEHGRLARRDRAIGVEIQACVVGVTAKSYELVDVAMSFLEEAIEIVKRTSE
jgi:hypothetical protein